ncbi:MAG: preprotein translocase subunit SecG [Opitutales bacterium]
MDAIILGIFSFLMVLICVVLVFFVLMQKPNSDAGMGSALGSGAAETAFGGEASNILTKFTVRAVVLYFILAFCLYLGYIYASSDSSAETAVATPSFDAITEESSTTVAQPMMEVATPAEAPASETPAEATPVTETTSSEEETAK